MSDDEIIIADVESDNPTTERKGPELNPDKLVGFTSSKFFIPGLCLVLALLSFFGISELLSSPTFHAGTLAALDEKAGKVAQLIMGSLGTAGAISLLPGDVGSPISTQLVNLNSYFVIVLAAIYLEKYLVTILGFFCFKILVPFSLVCFAIAVLINEGSGVRAFLGNLGKKILILGLALFIAIPVSIQISTLIEATYQASMDQTIAETNKLAEVNEQAVENDAVSEDDIIGNILKFLDDGKNTIVNSTTGAVEAAQDLAMGVIEALAVMIVTSCVIPIVVLLFFLWLVKVILDVEIPVSKLKKPLGRKK